MIEVHVSTKVKMRHFHRRRTITAKSHQATCALVLQAQDSQWNALLLKVEKTAARE
jgi:hypothetical protein